MARSDRAMGHGAPRFEIELARAVEPEALRAWFALARPGERLVYAEGVDLPRAAEAVAIVRRWAARGAVALTQQIENPRSRWRRFLCEKCADGAPGAARAAQDPSARQDQASGDARAVFGVLLAAARAQRICPSLNEIARALGWGIGERARQRARRAIHALEREGKITICAPRGPFQRRQITIASGPHAGTRTREV